MLFGTMPGDTPVHSSTLFAALPSYAALIAQYLDRYGPYRLQPYAAPLAPAIVPTTGAPGSVAPVAPLLSAAAPMMTGIARAGGRGGPYRDMSPTEARLARIDDMMRRGIASGDFSANPFSGNTNQMSGFAQGMVRAGLEGGLSPAAARHSAMFAEQRNLARGRYATPSKRHDRRGDRPRDGGLKGSSSGKSGHPGRPGGPM